MISNDLEGKLHVLAGGHEGGFLAKARTATFSPYFQDAARILSISEGHWVREVSIQASDVPG